MSARVDFAALRQTTAPALLLEHALRRPTEIAYRAKKRGLYRERSWHDYAVTVAGIALGFRRLGLGAGERVAIMGDASEEWIWCDLAAQATGAVTYGIYPTASIAELEHLMRDGGATIFIAEDQEYLDKILPIAARLPQLRWIVVVDASAIWACDQENLRRLDEIVDAVEPEMALKRLGAMVAALRAEDPAFIVYTSGTTGPPKGAVVAHGRHLAATANLIEHYPLLAEAQRTVVYLPLCHVLGRDVAITLPLIGGLVPHFGDDIEALPRTLFEVAPSVLFTVPRYLQKFAAQILVAIAGTSPLKRIVYHAALRHARRHRRRHWDGTARWASAALYRLLYAIAFRPILNQLGFASLRLLVSGGAPLSPETAALWQIYGVNLVEMYGQTETAGGIISGQRGPFPRPGDVGTVPAGWAVKLAESGEILVHSDDLFEGYWNEPELSRAAWDGAGWLRTGDIGEWREDRLRLVDRARDFIVTSGGKTLSPSFIENILRASAFIAEAVVIGHGRNYLTALIEIDFDTVAEWARRRDIAYAGFTSLAQHAAVRELLAGEIAKANVELARVEQIKDFRILPKALDPEQEDEPVTPTRKVKRGLMSEHFRELVDSMYDDREARLVAEHTGGTLDH